MVNPIATACNAEELYKPIDLCKAKVKLTYRLPGRREAKKRRPFCNEADRIYDLGRKPADLAISALIIKKFIDPSGMDFPQDEDGYAIGECR